MKKSKLTQRWFGEWEMNYAHDLLLLKSPGFIKWCLKSSIIKFLPFSEWTMQELMNEMNEQMCEYGMWVEFELLKLMM